MAYQIDDSTGWFDANDPGHTLPDPFAGGTPSPYAPPPGTPGVDPSQVAYTGANPSWDHGPAPLAPGVTWADMPPQTDPATGIQYTYTPTTDSWVPASAGTGGGGTGGGGGTTDGRSDPNDPRFAAPPVPGREPAPHIPTPPGMPDPLAPWTEQFNAPNPQDVLTDPAFQASLNEGLKQIQRSAASRGTLLTGGTLKGLQDYGQTKANGQYQQVYDNTYNAYDSRRQNFLTNEANRFNSQKSNAMDTWNNEMGQYQMERLNRGDTFDEGAALFGMQNTNRMNNWGIASDYFNQGQTQRMNDFSIYNTTDMSNWLKNFSMAQLGKPTSPTGA